MKVKKFSFSSSIVSSWALFATAVPANRIKAMNTISMIMEVNGNPRELRAKYIAPKVAKADKTYKNDKTDFTAAPLFFLAFIS